MYWSDIGYLCREEEKLDELRHPYRNYYDKKEVYCNSKGVKRNEFYQAQAQGYRPELCVEVNSEDFGGESHFIFQNIIYRIIRTYPVKGEKLELICQALVSEDGKENSRYE